MPDNSVNNKRIAKNTVVLYIRTIFVMLIALYTSRVVLNALGVEDYGVYNAIGGVVSMFAVISGALSGTISRFITFELGTGNKDKLSRVFCTSVNIQIIISVVFIIVMEVLGVWFLNNKMSIPDGRMEAANWVLQFSIISFVIGMISVPYNSCIIAHEHMNAFAYISIADAVLKLAIVYLLSLSSFDKLVTYSLLLTIVAIIIRLAYGVYCRANFAESKYRPINDKSIFKEMFGFAGWSFLTNGAWIFNTQGVSMLINVYFGVALNAARGIAGQVEGAVMQFVNNFTTAINPQITKSYAEGNKDRMYYLICKGSKMAFFLMLIFSVPIMFETEYILKIWLKIVPEYTTVFVRLSFVAAIINLIGNTALTACSATGRIKEYSIYCTLVVGSVFFITWILFHFGFSVEWAYIVLAVMYGLVEVVRLLMMKKLIGFPPMLFVREVIYKCLLVTTIAVVFPTVIVLCMNPSILRLVISLIVGCLSSCLTSYFFGLTKGERVYIKNFVVSKFSSKTRRLE